jgi:DNA-binding NtrC family response regulator
MVMDRGLLDYKRILIVDDEPDVLDTLEALLPMCDVVTASSFEEAKGLLKSQYFDMAILDIMGIEGYSLLEIANQRGVIPVMLTAHALSVDNTIRAFKEGAASFVPKEEMANIVTFLNDILEAKEKGKPLWWRWTKRFASYYDRKFGLDWRKKDKDFWEKFRSWG